MDIIIFSPSLPISSFNNQGCAPTLEVMPAESRAGALANEDLKLWPQVWLPPHPGQQSPFSERPRLLGLECDLGASLFSPITLDVMLYRLGELGWAELGASGLSRMFCGAATGARLYELPLGREGFGCVSGKFSAGVKEL